MRSTVKSVFLLACLLEALPYMAKNLFKCKQTLHQVRGVLATLHQTHGVLTPLNVNHSMGIYHSSVNHNLLTTMYE